MCIKTRANLYTSSGPDWNKPMNCQTCGREILDGMKLCVECFVRDVQSPIVSRPATVPGLYEAPADWEPPETDPTTAVR